MGRYYSGDIEGKFWFRVQSSGDGEFFGCEANVLTIIDYYAEDLEEAEIGLQKCFEALGEYKIKLDQFFSEHSAYNDKQLAETLNVCEAKAQTLLLWYARRELGEKIINCLKEKGHCEFEAEL